MKHSFVLALFAAAVLGLLLLPVLSVIAQVILEPGCTITR